MQSIAQRRAGVSVSQPARPGGGDGSGEQPAPGLDPSTECLIAFVVEQQKVVRTKGAGWVDYMWPRPGQTDPVRKWSYVKGVKVEGVPAYVGAGFYPR